MTTGIVRGQRTITLVYVDDSLSMKERKETRYDIAQGLVLVPLSSGERNGEMFQAKSVEDLF